MLDFAAPTQRLILNHQTASPHALYDVLVLDGGGGKPWAIWTAFELYFFFGFWIHRASLPSSIFFFCGFEYTQLARQVNSTNVFFFFGFESTQLARQLYQERTQMEAQ